MFFRWKFKLTFYGAAQPGCAFCVVVCAAVQDFAEDLRRSVECGRFRFGAGCLRLELRRALRDRADFQAADLWTCGAF